MEINENYNELKEVEESGNLLKMPLSLNEDNYLLRIILSKDNISIIFKLEKEMVQTFYYYGKFDYKDFIKINKRFDSDNNINNIFIHLKEIIYNYTCSLKKNQMIMNIIFIKNKPESTSIFKLRKKIVAQNRLNFQLIEQIKENKAKIKLLKKQLTKLDKTIQNKNDIIDKINNRIIKIGGEVNNIHINKKNYDNNDSNNIKKNNNTQKDKSSPSKEKDDVEEINELKKYFNNEENELLKQNLSLIKDFQKSEMEKEKKRYISNNRKKMNKNKLKKLRNIFQNGEKINEEDDALFCFGKEEVFNNKKIYEALIIFNIITVLIIMYLLCNIYSLKTGYFNDRFKDENLEKKVAFISLYDEAGEKGINGIRENIVDFQLKNDDYYDKNTNSPQKMGYTTKGKKNEKKAISPLFGEREKKYFKKHIRRRLNFKVKDINFELKYTSFNAKNYRNIFNNLREISDNLILIKNKKGKKLAIFSKNIFELELEQNYSYIRYSGYVFDKNEVKEMDLLEFFSKYGKYIQDIYKFLVNTNFGGKNRYNNSSLELLGKIERFEIYNVKYIK